MASQYEYWSVSRKGHRIDTVQFVEDSTEDYVLDFLIASGYPDDIEVEIDAGHSEQAFDLMTIDDCLFEAEHAMAA